MPEQPRETEQPREAEQPAEADDLFGLSPEQFTEARNALAKRLRSAGEREQAARVGALRRPTVTAWALNQLSRRQPDIVQEVIHAGERLRQATEEALAGDRSTFAAAQAAERAAIQRVVDEASKLLELGGGKASEQARQRMTETLRAATVEDSSADLVRRGVLESDLSAPGFGMEGIPNESLSRLSRSRSDDDLVREQEAARVRLQTELDQVAARMHEARLAAEEAEARADHLRRQADRVQKEYERAKKRLDEDNEPSN